MKLAVLDAATLGADLSFAEWAKLGELTVYPTTPPETLTEHLAGCEVAILNKVKITRETLEQSPSLRLICVAATGYDNIDTEACREHGVAVCNVEGYSTHSVAQVTLSLALSLMTRLPDYTAYVRSGAYTESGVQNRLEPVYHELCGKTWGVVGLGNIGRQVAKVAEAMGCRVLAFKRIPDGTFPCVSLDELCARSDVISLHVPLNSATRGCIGEEQLALMKPSAVLINVARGAVVDEEAVTRAIEADRLAGFGSDVYDGEPMAANSPFQRISHRNNVLLTPHMAWGAYESRVRCMGEITENVRAFYRGDRRNRVD